MSVFKWNSRREAAAIALAQGYSEREAAVEAKVTDRTIRRWKKNLEFSMEVDRLSLMVGIAGRAERLRIAMKVVRQKVQDDEQFVLTNKDILDWLKFAQSETDGVKLDLTAIAEATASVADSRQGGMDQPITDNGRPDERERARLLRSRAEK